MSIDDPTIDALADEPRDDGAFDVLRRGWRAMPELRRGAPLTIALAALGATGRLITPVLLQQAIDHGLRTDPVRLDRIVWLAVIAALALLVTTQSTRVAVRRLGLVSEDALCALRITTFAHLQDLSIADHGDHRRGTLVARVTSDVERLSQFFSWGGLSWLINSALITAVAVTMFVYDWRLALVAISTAAPVVMLMRLVQHRLVRAYDAERSAVGEYLAVVSESISGAPTIRAYGLGPRLRAQTDRAIDTRRRSADRAGITAAFLFPVGELFGAATVSAVVAAGLWLGPDRGVSAGSLVAFMFLTNRFLEPVAEFTEVLDQTQTAVAGLRRILAVLDIEPEVSEAKHPIDLSATPPTIAIDDVTFRYRARRGQRVPERNALESVSIVFPAGRSAAVVGATGSGKSTLAKLITRMTDPDAGSIRFDGVDLRDASLVSLRRAVVLVPQEPFLFDTTIADNIGRAVLGSTVDDAARALDELGLTDWLAEFPAGINTRVGERGDRLSAGERQLVALARAQLVGAPCLVLDEATSSVDPATEARLARAVAAITQGRTTITIAHRLSTAMRADLICVLERGKLVQSGPHAELLATPGHYRRLHADWLRATTGSGTEP